MFDTECEFYNHLVEILNPTFNKYKNVFSTFKTNLERINFFVKNLPGEELSCQYVPNLKNDERAIEFREKGNTQYMKENYNGALENYNLSIAWAKTKPVRGLAFANRSAILSRMGLYKESIIDIDKALEDDVPEKMSLKLLERQKKSSQQLQHVSNKSVKTKKVCLTSNNKLIQSGSDSIQINYNKHYGRHLRATRQIKIGELLVVEEPYTSLLTKEFSIHCNECMSLCYNLIPCEHCTEVLYCSEKCKVKAFQNYHRYECPILYSLINFFGPLKNILLFCMKLTILSNNELVIKRNKDVYYSDRYDEISSLLTHSDKQSIEKLFVVSCISALVFNLIKEKTALFEDFPNFEDVFKELFLQNLQIIEVNVVEISRVEMDITEGFRNVGYAMGIYSLYSLFNHSCYPNAFFYHQGSTIIVRANSTIKKGEQCFISYGYHFNINSKIERQTLLMKKYLFKCACIACEENWPSKRYSKKFRKQYAYILENLIKGNKQFAKTILPMIMSDLKKREQNVRSDSAITQIQQLVIDCFYVSEIL